MDSADTDAVGVGSTGVTEGVLIGVETADVCCKEVWAIGCCMGAVSTGSSCLRESCETSGALDSWLELSSTWDWAAETSEDA